MSDDRRIFVDEEPAPRGGSGPWLLLMVAAMVLAATTFVLSNRELPDDQAVVQLPVATTPSTTTTTQPPTTTTTQPPLLIERLVPAFDRSLTTAAINPDGLTVTRWAPGSPPQARDHDIGTVAWADFDASGLVLAASTLTSNGQTVLWVGPWNLLEPVIIEVGHVSAAFHTTEPSTVAVATAIDGQTTIATYAIDLGDLVDRRSQHTLEGEHQLVAWTEDAFYLVSDEAVATSTKLSIDGAVETLEDTVMFPVSGAPLLFALDRSAPTALAAVGGEVVEVSASTRSVSPAGRYAIVDDPFLIQLVDLERDVALPLTDSVSFIADWSADERWFVYMSDIESFRLGTLTRLVFVDTDSGSSVSVSLTEDQITAPHMVAVGP